MWMLYITATIVSIIQIHSSAGCNIKSATSPSASSLNVLWEAVSQATSYQLELRVPNSTDIAPVVTSVTGSVTEKKINGLRPGHHYEITLKVLRYVSVVDSCHFTSMTVPDTVQITSAKAVSSTSIKLEWASVTGADNYTVHVEKFSSDNTVSVLTFGFPNSPGEVLQLLPSTTYMCYITATNRAGSGTKGSTKTISTLVPPPDGVNATATTKSSALVKWNARSGVLMYQVSVTHTGNNTPPVIKTTSKTFQTIDNLEPCSNYTLGVSSLDAFLTPGEPTEVSYITSNINPVTMITNEYDCTTATVTVTWDQVFGANAYMATVTDGTGKSLNCTSSGTSCDISELKCGEKYSTHVTVISDNCRSTDTLDEKFDTVPCGPANPVIDYSCSSSAITYKWESTNNTLFYVAKSIDHNGQVQECRTLNTWCYYTNVGCGETYTFTVQSIALECNSGLTNQQTIKTAPCLPQNIITSTDCTSDKLTTTWDDASGAVSYTLLILGNTNNYNCTTVNNSCELDGVSCGEHFSVTVTASNEDCTTPEVLGEVAETGPCTPTNLTVSNDCSPDTAQVSWVESRGVVFYTVTATDSNGTEYTCYNTEPTCEMKNLKCGETYSVSVMGTNAYCNSLPSASANFQTASCPPTNVVAERNCTNNQASISWESHHATGSYTAVIEDGEGDRYNCTSSTVNSCIIPSPPCGKTYSVTVTYNYGNCSLTSTPVSMDSVPCQPENVTADVTCITGELTVTWTSPTPAEKYMTEITGGTPSQTIFCNSNETQCLQEGLDCGSSYEVTVYSLHGSCSSLPSSQFTVQTIPCAPSSVSVQKACSPNNSSVSWVTSAGATKYIAEAVSGDGSTSKCESQQTSCSFSDLQCGQVYTISVSGVKDTCPGLVSSNISLQTEPCSPVNVSSQLDCLAGTAMVSWAASANAANYSVKATNTGSSVYCHGPSTSCTLHGLDCNAQHTITVTASDDKCTSDDSAPFDQGSVPCAPQNVQTSLTCSTNNVVVSWDEVSTSWDYNVTAVSSSGQAADASCTTRFSNCTLNTLVCGQNYTVTVVAFSGSCVGPTSSPVIMTTAPCGTANLNTELTCGSNTLDVSMSAASGAASYLVIVSGPDGFSKNCTVTSLTCQITSLQCATEYNVSAVVQSSTCSSSPTQTVVTTGPCDPANVNSNLICRSNSAIMSWDAAPGADAYTVTASEVGSQYETSCRNNTPSCQLNQLNCGKNYTVTVVSEGATCNSTGTTTSLTTAPCSPTIQYYNLTCGTNSSSLTWSAVQSATGYVVDAVAGNELVSCNSTTTECILTGLKCSQNYTTTVIAKGNECDSDPSTSFTVSTAPCPPSITSLQYICDSSTASIGWSDTGGSTGYTAEVIGSYTDSCDTIENNCDFQNLPCGLNLHIKVKAKGPQCNSEYSFGDTFETVPCAPENVSATLICDADSAMVTWAESSLAVNYTVTASGQTSVSHCHNVSNSCIVQGLQCGEDYNITVTSHSAKCTGHTSNMHNFKAGLCAPTTASVLLGCQSSTVNWSNVPGAEKVIAKATNDIEQTYTCESNSTNSCVLPDIPCGGNYSVSVVTVDRGCNSVPKSAGQLKTVQCPPTNLDGSIDCETNTVTLTWDQSSVPGTNYSIKRELIGSGAGPNVFTSSVNTYTMNDLQCGESYNFSVAAKDGNCLTSYSPFIQLDTAPCEPTSFTAHVDCGSNNGTFSWSEGKGASSHTVQVTGEHGHKASCTSNNMACVIKLDCGRFYSATLLASTDTCNTTKSANRVIDSAPCLPENVEGVVNCSTNVMKVTWKEMPAPENYTAWAIATDGHNASCTSQSNFCSISDLECGRVYDVVVSASSIDCNIIAGSDYKVQSAPCKPESMTVDLNCTANAVTVSWTQLNTNQNNTVTATSDSGVSTCQTLDTSCSFLNLTCGTHYTFLAVAQTNVCMSESSTMDKTTAPCAPTAVAANLDCNSKEAVVTWNISDSAESYRVQAQSSDGNTSFCTDPSTTCNLQQLLCGQEYTVSVEAVNTGCTGPASDSTTFITEPCVPVNVIATYTVGVAQNDACTQGVTSEQIQLTTEPCPPNNVQANMKCGQHSAGESNRQRPSNETSVVTEPCQPSKINVTVDCEAKAATVFWLPSDGAQSYVTELKSSNHSDICRSNNSNCQPSHLHCGEEYNVSVMAVGQSCNTTGYMTSNFYTEPCEVTAVSVSYTVGNAAVQWNVAKGATSYSVQAVSDQGATSVCNSNSTQCTLGSLQCSELYNVSVSAHNQACASQGVASDTKHLTTEPCPPTNVHTNVDCTRAHCDAVRTDSSCVITGLDCGMVYSAWVIAKGEQYNSSESNVISFISAPCYPRNSTVQVDCSSNGATVSWTLCSTQQTSCNILGLSCGQTYSLNLTATNEQCSVTAPTQPSVNTRPCPLTGVSTSYDCLLGNVTVNWQNSAGADKYIATLTSATGLSSNCTSQSSTCSVSEVPCGQNFTVSVTASNAECTISSTEPKSQTTAPCVPTNVDAVMDCATDTAAVSWTTSSGAVNYTVTAQSTANNVSCETPGLSCTLTNLICGTQYTIHVVANDDTCSSAASQAIILDSAPCPPDNVDAVIDCATDDLKVSWTLVTQAQYYLVSVIGQNGGSNKTCNTTISECTLSSVTCGNTFVAQVTAARGSCQSRASQTASAVSKPCRPNAPDVVKSCGDAEVSWILSPVADMYHVVAVGDNGHTHTCNTTFDNCTLSPLHCDQQYSVFMTARHENCSSLTSPNVTLYTGPCKPDNVLVTYDCHESSALLTWNEKSNAVDYYASAVDENGSMLYCQNSSAQCTFKGLQCGNKYNFTVLATDGSCNSSYSDPVDSMGAVPCPPENVAVQLLPQQNDRQVLSLGTVLAPVTSLSLSLDGQQIRPAAGEGTSVMFPKLNELKLVVQ
ncbi:hypothetical protein WMY93_001439 [Mugilogobius chulae]|uniref:Fibronectin type-III domain-containing protein n=1 Tax=Mugilogobius chulae TaxID=88201 RepID=A0AAW0Q299_9GOBI